MTDVNAIAADAMAVADWFDALPDDFRRYVAFRAERVGDPEFLDLNEILKTAAKLSRWAKKERRQAQIG
jgi:hypothetical protein